MSKVVYLKRRPSDIGGSPRGHRKKDGRLIFIEDHRPDATEKTKTFLAPREVVEFSWHGQAFSVSLKINGRELAIINRFSRAVDRVLSHIHAFYFEGAFGHLSKDDPGRTPFIVESVKDWTTEDGVLSIVFLVSQPSEERVAGKSDGGNAEDWKCRWYFKPIE